MGPRHCFWWGSVARRRAANRCLPAFSGLPTLLLHVWQLNLVVRCDNMVYLEVLR
jgi:hypothetical protein